VALGLCFGRHHVSILEEVGAQLLVEGGILSPQPFQHHAGVLFLLVPVVTEDCLQLFVGCRIDPLIVPVDRFELLHERHGGAMAVNCRGG
jgi:hypothetical protein